MGNTSFDARGGEAVSVEGLRLRLADCRQALHDAKTSADLAYEAERAFELMGNAIAALRSDEQRAAWRDISTAPKDGTFVLLHHPRAEPSVSMGFWNDAFGITKNAGWMMIEADTMASAYDPTYWRPLPAPPTPDAAKGEA